MTFKPQGSAQLRTIQVILGEGSRASFLREKNHKYMEEIHERGIRKSLLLSLGLREGLMFHPLKTTSEIDEWIDRWEEN